MITLHELNGKEFVLNSDLIERLVQEVDHSVIHLLDASALPVTERTEEIVNRIQEWRRSLIYLPLVETGEDVKSDKKKRGARDDG